jgi:hypothetical protein
MEQEVSELPELKDKQDFEKRIIRRRHEFRVVVGALIVLVVAIIIFLAGMVVGRIQDSFQARRTIVQASGMQAPGMMNGNLGTPFGTPGMLGGINGQRSMANANGAQGTITAINGDNLTVNGNNGVNSTINITSSTIIRQETSGGQDLKISDLHTGETVTVLGDPDSQGQIVAKYIGVK